MTSLPTMSTVTKFDIDKFDGKISFAIWRVQMRAVLTQHGLKKALEGKAKVLPIMTEEQWTELDERALSSIQLCLTREVLREVIHEASGARLWSKLESLYMTKSLANKVRLKEKLYTLRMKEGSELQARLNEFSSILIDLENLDIKIEDEDKAEIMLYGNNAECICLEDVKSNLLAKEKFDIDKPSDAPAEGLYAKGKDKNGSNTKSKSKSKFKTTNSNTSNNKSCKYCKKAGHECYKLKNKEKYAGKEHSNANERRFLHPRYTDEDINIL
ncbi:hypothetical protein V2J09_003093 [Rumex salicifolius]